MPHQPARQVVVRSRPDWLSRSGSSARGGGRPDTTVIRAVRRAPWQERTLEIDRLVSTARSGTSSSASSDAGHASAARTVRSPEALGSPAARSLGEDRRRRGPGVSGRRRAAGAAAAAASIRDSRSGPPVTPAPGVAGTEVRRTNRSAPRESLTEVTAPLAGPAPSCARLDVYKAKVAGGLRGGHAAGGSCTRKAAPHARGSDPRPARRRRGGAARRACCAEPPAARGRRTRT